MDQKGSADKSAEIGNGCGNGLAKGFGCLQCPLSFFEKLMPRLFHKLALQAIRVPPAG
jgi:hypothetical protein